MSVNLQELTLGSRAKRSHRGHRMLLLTNRWRPAGTPAGRPAWSGQEATRANRARATAVRARRFMTAPAARSAASGWSPERHEGDHLRALCELCEFRTDSGCRPDFQAMGVAGLQGSG